MGALNTGPRRTIPFKVNTGVKAGQGEKPVLWARYSTSEASDTNPIWADVTHRVREWSFTRGRESELDEIDAGTCSLTVDNQDREFDPTDNALVGPMNRVWLLEQFNGLTNSMFTGYVEDIDLQWPGGGWSDATATFSAADEFKVLAARRLPSLDPVTASTYADVVLSDDPDGYWQFNNEDNLLEARVGAPLGIGNPNVATTFLHDSGPIRGDYPNGVIDMFATGYVQTGPLASYESGEVGGSREFAIEFWFMTGGNVSTPDRLIMGPTSPGATPYTVTLNPAGTLTLEAQDDTPVTHTITSSTAITLGGFHHIVGTIVADTMYLYLNGVEVGQTPWSEDPFEVGNDTPFIIGAANTEEQYRFDEIAVYRHGLTAERVTAHYEAAQELGLNLDDGDDRIFYVLEAAGSQAPRSLRDSSRIITPIFFHGQGPLEEIRKAVTGEAGDSLFFTSRSGVLTFLDANHRAASPWNTVQATFGDEGTAGQLPYLNLDVDYSGGRIYNVVNVTRIHGETQTQRDQDSVDRYGETVLNLTDVPVTTDLIADDIAEALLLKYKSPMARLKTIELDTSDINVTDNVFQRELGDRVRGIRTWPGGLGWFDQTAFIQKIEASGANDQKPWVVRFGVSPL